MQDTVVCASNKHAGMERARMCARIRIWECNVCRACVRASIGVGVHKQGGMLDASLPAPAAGAAEARYQGVLCVQAQAGGWRSHLAVRLDVQGYVVGTRQYHVQYRLHRLYPLAARPPQRLQLPPGEVPHLRRRSPVSGGGGAGTAASQLQQLGQLSSVQYDQLPVLCACHVHLHAAGAAVQCGAERGGGVWRRGGGIAAVGAD